MKYYGINNFLQLLDFYVLFISIYFYIFVVFKLSEQTHLIFTF